MILCAQKWLVAGSSKNHYSKFIFPFIYQFAFSAINKRYQIFLSEFSGAFPETRSFAEKC
ncbi:hypothetical protein AUK22_08325 [bacterium CG2_30_54_10]|nr:MAG: hypothetical protein AUK22_08325 [bacterium CG2_30_54_10]